MFHLLHTDIAPPESLNSPFRYEPHILTLLAARSVCDYLATRPDWAVEVGKGKMFGVLVCADADGRLGFLAAYSGQLLGRADWPWFVPAVFDYLQPDGHFKQEEARISQINRQVAELEASEDYIALVGQLQTVRDEAALAINNYRDYTLACKSRRDALRRQGDFNEQELISESQYQKAELRRLKKLWEAKTGEAEQRLAPLTQRLEALKEERRQRSDELQLWLFHNFILLNSIGERRSLFDIFDGMPPSGAGECCAPKLFHYAFLHHLRPLCIGEFWQGKSPRMEVRHHGKFYPACRGKCKPILEWMLSLQRTSTDEIEVQRTTADMQRTSVYTQRTTADEGLRIVYSDESILVVCKPSGLLSVPGKNRLPSVESLLTEDYGRVYMVHRLDMDTSGLLVVARTTEAYHHLQRQFLQRAVHKEYVALLEGVVSGEGTISLPLRPDLDDRPRQLVDHQYGKPATTYYKVLGVKQGITHILLIPHTGRTHQLRIHCAHAEGLATPIVGDALYGHNSSRRLCLHARTLTFIHPTTQQPMTFTAEAPF
ncbi:MAG: RluA family pseudouridine synthase [Prevotella sp.]|nr:RluA family pseudouridine synthase [Prevotella sp.]